MPPASDPADPPPVTAYVALGANLGDRAANLRSALALLAGPADGGGVAVTRVSSFLENPAVGGPAGSPPFLNAVAEMRTALDPVALLGRLLEVERRMGRVRDARWGPRVIDLDLVLFGDRVVDLPELKVPHPLMHERDFVLLPLAEVAPGVRHPTLGKTVGELAAAMVAKGEPRGSAPEPSPHLATSPPLALSLRRATNADGPAVRDLVFSVLREYGLAPDPYGTDLDLFDLEGRYARAGGRFDVLVDGAGVVRGSAALSPVDAETCELRKMYLHRSARGQGWGRRLLDAMLAEARRRGFKRVTLETASVLKEAIGLYERYGFVPCDIDPVHKTPRCDAAYELHL